MRFARTYVVVFLSFAVPISVHAQQTTTTTTQPSPQRDPQAVAIVQQSVEAVASTAPSDSSATGTVAIVEGSTTVSGTIQILTLGIAQTSETLTLPSGQRVVVYSNGDAKETTGTQSTVPTLELAVNDQCTDFPLPLLLAALYNPDSAFRYIGAESLNGTPVKHIQLSNAYSSNSRLRPLAPFSTKDIWFDSTSGLPLKIAYVRRAGAGEVPSFAVEVSFSNYTRVNGVLYPFQIEKSFNGTPWQTITIQSVSFNTGLTASQFQVE